MGGASVIAPRYISGVRFRTGGQPCRLGGIPTIVGSVDMVPGVGAGDRIPIWLSRADAHRRFGSGGCDLPRVAELNEIE